MGWISVEKLRNNSGRPYILMNPSLASLSHMCPSVRHVGSVAESGVHY
jgi:hypothetical protein